MATLGKRPGRGKGFVTYTWDSVPPGAKRNGYLAGDVHGLMCHVGKKTKPCKRHLISPTADCSLCDAHQPTDWVGYVPLRDHTGRPVCVIIRSAVADLVDRLDRGARVMWGRDDDRFSPVWIIAGTLGPPWKHWWPDRQPADDMVPWLCTFWRDSELQSALYSYFNQQPLPAASAPQPALPDVPIPHPQSWVKGVQDKGAQQLGYSDFPSLARAVQEGKKGEPTNGKKRH